MPSLRNLMDGIDLEGYGVELVTIGPLWNSELLPQLYVRRVLEAVPQIATDPHDIGLLLVGRGHATGEGRESPAMKRYTQERQFQERVKQALVKVDSTKAGSCWVGCAGIAPRLPEAFQVLAAAGCKAVLWMPSSFPADGLISLYDVPSQLNPLAKNAGIRLNPLGAWNADDLAAEDIAARVRALSLQSPVATPLHTQS